VAVSGGLDSMTVLNLLMKYPKNQIEVLHVDHGTNFGKYARQFVTEYCAKHELSLKIHEVTRDKPKGESWEEFWRNERLSFFHGYGGPVFTGHSLNDCVETWVMTCLHGQGKIIPVFNKNIVRNFMLNTREEFESFQKKHGVPFMNDPSNESRDYMRNVVRHDILPHALMVNPGLFKVVKKKLLDGVGDVDINSIAA
jgi:tRNA(Ile)-lysidine synthase